MPYTREEHRIASAKIQRDSKGHFIHTEPNKTLHKTNKSNPVENFIKEHIKDPELAERTSYHKSQDDILDVHVGNPLHKITQLLKEIKKQKAFSFTLKGSLGIAGVVLALGVFGIFGGGKILCDKGVQSQIGIIKTLNVMETESPGVPILSQFLDYFNPKQTRNKIVLIKNDQTAISILGVNNQTIAQWNNNYVIATGNYDTCSQSLTISDPQGIEIYSQ